MKCEYFVVARTKQSNRKTPIYFIVNKEEDCIGEIKWYGPWRKFCFYPDKNTVWDSKCLNEVIEVIQQVTEI